MPFIAFGGTFLLRGIPPRLCSDPSTAGHAHAGVLVILGIVIQLAVDLAGVKG